MFEFIGDWETQIKLEGFSILNNPEYVGKKVFKEIFDITIYDVYNDNPDPEEYQLNTINWLCDIDNQKEVLNNLFVYCKNIVYPHYKTFMLESEYPEYYPTLNEVKDLYLLIAIRSIEILSFGKDNKAYYNLTCESCLDHEHGIKFGAYGNLILEHGENLDNDKIFEHLGHNPFLNRPDTSRIINRDVVLSGAHPKYSKFKPWQVRAIEYYPFGLYHNKRDKELIEDLENKIIKNQNINSRLFCLAIQGGRENLIQYFIDKKLENTFGPFREALKKDRYDLTNKILKQGVNLNSIVAHSSLFSETIGFLAVALKQSKDPNQYLKRLRYLLTNGLDPYLEDNFKRNSLTRIERIDDEKIRTQVKKYVMQIIKEFSNT